MDLQDESRFYSLPIEDQEFFLDVFRGKKLPPLYSDIIAKKIFNLRLGISYWLRLSAFLVLISLTTYMSTTLELKWITSFFIAAAMCVIIAFITKMLNYNEIKELVVSSMKNIKK